MLQDLHTKLNPGLSWRR